MSTFQSEIDLSPLEDLQALRNKKVLLYAGMIHGDGLPALYRCLRQLERSPNLDLVLRTTGGEIVAARRFAFILRQFTERLTILVPHRAWSAGTLLCLSADELVLGPLAELGSVDPQIGSGAAVPPGAPQTIAAEDIRLFKAVARDWFGVTRDEDHVQLLALLVQHIFPATLTAFYRSDLLVRKIIGELLALQNRALESSFREKVERALIEDVHSHDYLLTPSDVEQLGLNVTLATPQEEELLWQVSEVCESSISPNVDEVEHGTLNIIAAEGVRATHQFEWVSESPSEDTGDLPVHRRLKTSWTYRGLEG